MQSAGLPSASRENRELADLEARAALFLLQNGALSISESLDYYIRAGTVPSE